MPDSLPKVTLVIPGRNCAQTLAACLDAVSVIYKNNPRLAEIIFVDDGSSDATPEIAARYPDLRVLQSLGRGAGAARNCGLHAANNEHELIWFVDSDTIPAADALDPLLEIIDESGFAGVSGSYDNARPDDWLACLIHEEIIERHLNMAKEVDFLATFNVLYRRDVLLELQGFDERYLKGQDAELSFRVKKAGHKLGFSIQSKVAHFHEDRVLKYMKTQAQQGFWRAYLHLEHSGHSGGDSYSKLSDHLQPPMAMLVLALLLGSLIFEASAEAPAVTNSLYLLTLAAALLLLVLTLPLTLRIVARTRQAKFLLFAELSFFRAFYRGVGLSLGVLSILCGKKILAAKEPKKSTAN